MKTAQIIIESLLGKRVLLKMKQLEDDKDKQIRKAVNLKKMH